MCSESPLANFPAEKFTDDSMSDETTQEQPAGQNSMVSDSLSLRNTVSPSLPPAPQTLFQKEDSGSDLVPLENHGESTGTEESQNGRPDAGSKETLHHPSPDADDSRSGGDPVPPENQDWSTTMNEGPNETSHASPVATLQDPLPHLDYDSSESRTDLQDTLSSRNASGANVGDEGPGELSIRKFVCVVAEIDVGSDFNRDSDGNDEDWSETRQDDLEASGMLLAPTLPTRTLRVEI